MFREAGLSTNSVLQNIVTTVSYVYKYSVYVEYIFIDFCYTRGFPKNSLEWPTVLLNIDCSSGRWAVHCSSGRRCGWTRQPISCSCDLNVAGNMCLGRKTKYAVGTSDRPSLTGLQNHGY